MGRPIEAQRLGGGVPVDGKGRAGQGRGAQRAFVHAGAGVGKASCVAAEHLDIGHQVVAEGHRLGGLQVGEARHQGVGVLPGLGQQGPLQDLELLDRAVASVAHPQAHVQRHLVIARAGGVQPSRGRADQFGQALFDIEVDVLELIPKGEGPGDHLGLDCGKALLYSRRVRSRDHALIRQHGGVGAGSGEVLGPQPLVEADRDIDRLHQVRGRGRETAAPHRVPSLGRGR